MLRDQFGETIQEIMEAELDTTLGCAEHENSFKIGFNRRNGHSKKMVVSEYGNTESKFLVTVSMDF
jgi:transposase-like protein